MGNFVLTMASMRTDQGWLVVWRWQPVCLTYHFQERHSFWLVNLESNIINYNLLSHCLWGFHFNQLSPPLVKRGGGYMRGFFANPAYFAIQCIIYLFNGFLFINIWIQRHLIWFQSREKVFRLVLYRCSSIFGWNKSIRVYFIIWKKWFSAVAG